MAESQGLELLASTVTEHINREMERVNAEISKLEDSLNQTMLEMNAVQHPPRYTQWATSSPISQTPNPQPVHTPKTPHQSANQSSTLATAQHPVSLVVGAESPNVKPNLNPSADPFRPSTRMTTTQPEDLMSVARALRKPLVEINKFSGDPLTYKLFRRQFDNFIGKNVDSYDDLMTYLVQYTTGEAHRIASGYAHLRADLGYPATIEEFDRRYGDSDIIAHAFMKRALEWPNIRQNDAIGLDSFGILLKECQYAIHQIQAMQVLEYSENMKKLVSKLPLPLHDRWRSLIFNMKE